MGTHTMSTRFGLKTGYDSIRYIIVFCIDVFSRSFFVYFSPSVHVYIFDTIEPSY
jgi:hypothetical protein